MATGTRFDSGIGVPEVDDEGDRPRGCQWDRSVCVDSPTHFIQWGNHGEDFAELITSAFCARHYAVQLAHYTEFHIRDCAGPVSAHLERYGQI